MANAVACPASRVVPRKGGPDENGPGTPRVPGLFSGPMAPLTARRRSIRDRRTSMAQDIVKRAKDDGVRFISLQFTDVTGSVKSADIPVERLPAALDEGVWFDGSSVDGFARIQESDIRLVLEPDSY